MKLNRNLIWDYRIPAERDRDDAFYRWYIARILMRGGTRDLRAVGFGRILRYLPHLHLPRRIRAFWDWYFETVYGRKKPVRHSDSVSSRRSQATRPRAAA